MIQTHSFQFSVSGKNPLQSLLNENNPLFEFESFHVNRKFKKGLSPLPAVFFP